MEKRRDGGEKSSKYGQRRMSHGKEREVSGEGLGREEEMDEWERNITGEREGERGERGEEGREG